MDNKSKGKGNLYLWGAIGGLVLGLISAYLYDRAITENAKNPDEAPSLDVASLIKLGLLLLGVVRQIAELGAEAGKNAK